jgi:hypothetical protein
MTGSQIQKNKNGFLQQPIILFLFLEKGPEQFF